MYLFRLSFSFLSINCNKFGDPLLRASAIIRSKTLWVMAKCSSKCKLYEWIVHTDKCVNTYVNADSQCSLISSRSTSAVCVTVCFWTTSISRSCYCGSRLLFLLSCVFSHCFDRYLHKCRQKSTEFDSGNFFSYLKDQLYGVNVRFW